MHHLTIRTKYTFGDRVRFDSSTQGCQGTGTIFAITVDTQGYVDYLIEVGKGRDCYLQPGILDDEITLLEGDA